MAAQIGANTTTPSSNVVTSDASLQRNVYVKIVEEPASKALRFRYECEGRSAGSLPGATSSQDKKSFPKIQVIGYRGRAVVVVSCVTVEPEYRPHPHNLVGKEGCKKGVCTMEISNEDMTCEFSNLGIQCVKKKDIEDSLKVREEIRVDPFRTGFQHKTQPGSIDLNSVRLCFQVFLEGPQPGQFKMPLKPVVSEPIYDKKAINDLTIMKLSDCTSPVMGNKEIILLCDKVSKDDIEIRFYEESEETGSIVWESFGDFQPSDVHKQYAICFRTPQYHNLEITSPSKVYVQLRCPSKDTTSAPRPFQYIPLLTSGTCKRKWNLLTFSGAYGSYMTTSASLTSSITSPTTADLPVKKHKPVMLEDILAQTSDAGGGGGNESVLVDPIYDRLNEFMGKQEVDVDEDHDIVENPVDDIYDVDLELISQIIKNQEEMRDGVDDGGVSERMIMEVDDLINGNNAEGLFEHVAPVPPTRPPKRHDSQQTQPATAPPLPPKKSTPKQSPTKQSPATFLKNLLFSPTKKKKNSNVAPPPPPAPQQPDTTTGPYELTENVGLYVDNEAPLATASEFDIELKRKRQKFENCRNLTQYIEHNKRPRQNSYPPVTSPTTPSPQLPVIQQISSPPPPSPHPQAQPMMYQQQQPLQLLSQQQQPQQILQQISPPPLPQFPQVYVKQEPISFDQQQQYYYDMIRGGAVIHPLGHPVQYSGGGIIRDGPLGPGAIVVGGNINDQGLHSDFSLPNLSDVNLSLLDQHLSENLNDMNLNNF